MKPLLTSGLKVKFLGITPVLVKEDKSSSPPFVVTRENDKTGILNPQEIVALSSQATFKGKEIKELLKDIVASGENLEERELENPEGAGFDLRIGELYELRGKGFLGIDERETPKIKLVAKYNKKRKKKVVLRPRTYYLMKTVEKLNLPENLLALFTPRSTLYRSGVYIFGGQTAPGYKGELTTGIYNFRDEKFELEMGARVIHIMFFEAKGKSNLYRGQWQGGRITTKKKEKQI